MDNTDYKIIAQLQKNSKISMKELAKRIHLSSSSTIERIRKLEDAKVIIGYGISVSLEKLDRPIEAIITYKTYRPGACNELADFCRRHSDVLTCYRVTGEASYIVHIATNSIKALETFIDCTQVYGEPSTNIILSKV